MRSEDCIEHKFNKHLQIRKDYLDLFEDDLCSALLLYQFEYLTNGEIDRMRGAKEDGQPWLRISVDQLQAELFNRFKERAIKERLAFFKDSGLINVESGRGGQVNRYLLSCETVTSMLSLRKRLPFEAGCTERTQDSEAGCAAGCAAECTTEVPGRTHYKEVEERIEKEEELPIVPLLEEILCSDELSEVLESLHLEDDVVKFVTDAYSRENRRAKLDNLKAKTNEYLCTLIQQSEQEHDVEPFRVALLRYLADKSTGLADRRWPIRTFLSQVNRYIHSLPQNSNGHGRASHPAAVDLPPVVLEPLACPTGSDCVNPYPDPIQKWNEIVTAGEPVDQWGKRDKPLMATLQDPDFLAALPKVLERCQAAHQAQGEEVQWLTFRWLLKQDKKGVDNWYKVATGDLAWATAKKGRAKKSAAQSAVEEALAQLGG